MNKRDIIIFISILILASVMCFPYLTMHYSTDTYTIIGDGYENYAINTFLNAGRIFSSAITWLSGYFNIPINIFVQVLFYIAIVLSCMSVMEIRKSILKIKPELNIWKEIIITCISYIIVFNFMYLENMYFVEIPIMAAGILFFIKSAQYIVDEKYIKSILFLIIGELCYQGTINFFITLTFVLLIIKHKKINIELIKKMVYAGAFCIIAVIINMVQIKICGLIFNMEQDRLGSISEIPSNILYIIKHLDIILIKSSDIFPKYLFIAFWTILFTVLCLSKLEKNRKNVIFPVVLITLVAIVASVAINIISLSSFGLGRMVFSVGALIGLIFMYLYCSTDILEEKSLTKHLLLLIFVTYFIANVLNYTILMYKNKQANELDKLEAQKVNEYIVNYEQENNIEVSKIAICYDQNITWCHIELKHESLFTHRGLMIWWCNVQTINYYTNRNLQKVDMNMDVYNEYFKGKNWNELNEEQFVFIDDTLYYCVY